MPVPRLRLQPLGDANESALASVIALEAASYPADEAASPEQIRFRLQHAPAYFLVAYREFDADDDGHDSGGPVGFVNGTLAAGDELEEGTMSHHDPEGTTLCIHSVVIDMAYRRQGYASAMLRGYIQRILVDALGVRRIALLAKAPLVEFYVRCGFAVTRLSPVVHGQEPWFELVLDCVKARQLPIVQVDAFSRELFDGNPAAVVVMPPRLFSKPTATEWMQNIAKENNLSETAFVAIHGDAHGAGDVVEYDLRWFTPSVEVKLCGHATLSSAFVLYEDGHIPPTAAIHFHTLSGVLICRLEVHDDGRKWIEMDFPLRDLQPPPPSVNSDTLAKGLGLVPVDLITIKQTQTTDVLVQVPTEKFSAIVPNMDTLASVEARGIVVTALAPANNVGVDFQSRFFAPAVGVPEDPVTGSAHCALANFWSNVLQKNHLYAHQACPHRGGYISMELPHDRKGRVLLKGEGIISLRGVLTSSP